MPFLKKAYEHLLQKAIPDLIVVTEVAAKYGVSCTAFFSLHGVTSRAQGWEATSQSKPHTKENAEGVSSGQRIGKVIAEGKYLNIRSQFYLFLLLKRASMYQPTQAGLNPANGWMGASTMELSRLPFLWILRKPQGVDSSDLLPPGFASCTQSQGLVVLGWAPQLKILAHPAIGGCFFHSGWGTCIESLAHGHPLFFSPLYQTKDSLLS